MDLHHLMAHAAVQRAIQLLVVSHMVYNLPMCLVRNSSPLGDSMYWIWRLRLLNIRLHQCSALYEAYERVLLGLHKVAADEVQQPLQVLY